jgi:hypothetical protein
VLALNRGGLAGGEVGRELFLADPNGALAATEAVVAQPTFGDDLVDERRADAQPLCHLRDL